MNWPICSLVRRFRRCASGWCSATPAWARLVLRTPSNAAADGFGRLFPWLALSGPAYTCGFNGLHNTSELLGIWPTLIPRALVEPMVRVELLGERA